MLKRRLVAALVVREGIVVQSMGFSRYLPVGRAEIAAEFLNQWGVDEIVLLDISATAQGRSISPALVKTVAAECFVPLAVGGGIRTLEDIDALLQAGADKVCLNQALFQDPAFVTRAAEKFGSQCIVASVDVKTTSDTGDPEPFRVYDYLRRRSRVDDPVAFCKNLESLGAGEVLLNAVHRDGSGAGFDIRLNELVSTALAIPVIALGGAGHVRHFEELLRRAPVRAACAGNFFHYAEQSVILTKAALLGEGLDVRLDTKAAYAGDRLDEDGRLLKQADDTLEHLLYLRIEKEVI